MTSPSYNTLTLTYRTDPSAGDIPAQVHFAPSPSSTPRPIALAFHAGGFTVGSASMVPATQVAALVKLGFVVVAPDYRLCPQVSVYAGAVADARAALRWCQTALPGLLPSRAAGVLADGSRVVALGHSAGATLALHVGAEPDGPKAVLDFYGPKLFDHEFWRTPLAAFAAVPKLDQAFLDQVLDGPVPTSSPPMFRDGKPDLTTPRNAWMISTLRDGNNIEKCIKDGGVARADPITHFHRDFPPTMFVHGTADIFAPKGVSAVACARLKELGVDAQMVRVEGAAHVFDFALTEQDDLFQGPVMDGLRFLAGKVGL